MELVLSLLVGGLFAVAVYLILRRSLVKLILGLAILGQAMNLLIFVAAGVSTGEAPYLKDLDQPLQQPYADPLPQALILTAIVIAFAVIGFTIALVHRAHQEIDSDDLNAYRDSE
ncbi:MAG: NADH-quinone oxidoreductase subunit K [Verrucomicrobiales bacterium]